MDRDEILDQLFEHALQTHTYAVGALMRPKGLTSEAALAEIDPLREKLASLYEAAGREVPRYLVKDE